MRLFKISVFIMLFLVFIDTFKETLLPIIEHDKNALALLFIFLLFIFFFIVEEDVDYEKIRKIVREEVGGRAGI